MSHPAYVLPSSRRALRRAVEIPCEVITRHVDEPLLYWATDLSPFGLWLETMAPMRIGEIVVVGFRPLLGWRGREITAFATVTRSVMALRGHDRTRAGMGLEFLDLSLREFGALSTWLRNRPPPLPKRRRWAREDGRALPEPRFARLAA